MCGDTRTNWTQFGFNSTVTVQIYSDRSQSDEIESLLSLIRQMSLQEKLAIVSQKNTLDSKPTEQLP